MNPCHYCGKPVPEDCYARVTKVVKGQTCLLIAHVDCEVTERRSGTCRMCNLPISDHPSITLRTLTAEAGALLEAERERMNRAGLSGPMSAEFFASLPTEERTGPTSCATWGTGVTVPGILLYRTACACNAGRPENIRHEGLDLHYWRHYGVFLDGKLYPQFDLCDIAPPECFTCGEQPARIFAVGLYEDGTQKIGELGGRVADA